MLKNKVAKQATRSDPLPPALVRLPSTTQLLCFYRCGDASSYFCTWLRAALQLLDICAKLFLSFANSASQRPLGKVQETSSSVSALQQHRRGAKPFSLKEVDDCPSALNHCELVFVKWQLISLASWQKVGCRLYLGTVGH